MGQSMYAYMHCFVLLYTKRITLGHMSFAREFKSAANTTLIRFEHGIAFTNTIFCKKISFESRVWSSMLEMLFFLYGMDPGKTALDC